MTILEYRSKLISVLQQLSADESEMLADILLTDAMAISRGELLTILGDDFNEAMDESISEKVYRLSLGEPIQYILGSCWFYGREIFVGPGCFIPRADTEIGVEVAIKLLKKDGLFADICTGSGAIAASIADARRDCKGFALELSKKALDYAERNLEGLSNVTLRRFDALDPDDYAELEQKAGGMFDLVISNPPYIPTEEIQELSPQVRNEPETALDGGEDGLRYYRAITAYSSLILAENGTLLFEIGNTQTRQVAGILQSYGFSAAVFKDYSGNDRFLLAKKG